MDAAEAERKMREMQEKMGKGKKRAKKPSKPAPGVNDQELYPTDSGLVDFRLARRGRRRGDSTVA